MEKKSFLKSKGFWGAAFSMFASLTTALTGMNIPAEVLTDLPAQVVSTIETGTWAAWAGFAASVLAMVGRVVARGPLGLKG